DSYPIQAIQGGHAVSLGHGRIVEGRVDKIEQRVGFSLLRHDRLPNVDDLRSLGAKTVNAQDLQRLAMEKDLQHARGAPCDLRPGEAAEIGMADFVRDLLRSEFPFGRTQ